MNINNIQKGQFYKNYKQLAVALEEEMYGGKQKQYQLESWKDYFDFEKEGQSFIILGIYSQQDINTNIIIHSRKNKYTDFILKLIVSLIYDPDYSNLTKEKLEYFYSVDITKKELRGLCGLITDNYSKEKSIYKKQRLKGMGKDYAKEEWFNTIDSISYQIIDRALEKLTENGIASVQSRCRIINSQETHIANDFEYFTIEKIKTDIMIENKWDSYFQIMSQNQEKNFYSLWKERAQEFLHILNFEQVYRIVLFDSPFTQKILTDFYQELNNIDNFREKNVVSLNEPFCQAAKKRLETIFSKTHNGKTCFVEYQKDLGEDFVEKGFELIDNTLLINKQNYVTKYYFNKNNVGKSIVFMDKEIDIKNKTKEEIQVIITQENENIKKIK